MIRHTSGCLPSDVQWRQPGTGRRARTGLRRSTRSRQRVSGPFGIAAALQRVNSSTLGGGAWGAFSTTSNGGAQTAVSSINDGYITAQAQQRIAVTVGCQFSPRWDVSASYSNVKHIPGTDSTSHNTAIFNTVGAVLYFKPATAWDLGAGYSYTRATKANGVSSNALYQQLSLAHAAEGYQHASGQTLNVGGGYRRDAIGWRWF